MRKDVTINVDTKTSNLVIDGSPVFGISGENLQGRLIFKLSEPIIGTGWLLIQHKDEINQIILNSNDDYSEYSTYILSSLLKAGSTDIQLYITEDENENGIPVFKSIRTHFVVAESIEITGEEPDDYTNWFDTISNKIAELDSAEKVRQKNEEARIERFKEFEKVIETFEKYNYLISEEEEIYGTDKN